MIETILRFGKHGKSVFDYSLKWNVHSSGSPQGCYTSEKLELVRIIIYKVEKY